MKLHGGDQFESKLGAMADKAKNAKVRVGFLENARYPDGKPVAMIAAIQNYGAPRAGIPPRPFFSNMIAAKQKEWPGAIAGLLKANNYDALRALDIAGAAIAGQLRQSIIDTNAPPLKPRTIVRKGGTAGMVYDKHDARTYPAKPLVATGHMLASVDHEVTT